MEFIILILFIFGLLIFSWIIGMNRWFINTKFYLFLQNNLKKLIEKNLLFFVILNFITFFLCYVCLVLCYDYFFSNISFFIFGILLIIPDLINFIFLNFLFFLILLNSVGFILIYFLFNGNILKKYILYVLGSYIFVLIVLLIYNIFDLHIIELGHAMMNSNGEFIDNLDIKESFKNLKKLSSNEILDKDLYNKTINSNLVVQSNKQGEFGVCYKNIEDVRELYKNGNYIIQKLCDNGLYLFGNGELIKNNQNELMHCFFAKKK